MIVQGFKSVIWVGAVAGAALSCYMVSLRVASERAALERVEARILVAKRDIRALDTELVTRGRVRQLERWNSDVLALAAPTEEQFLEGELQLASLTRIDPEEAPPVMMAVADERDAVSAPGDRPAVVLASLTSTVEEERPRLVRASAPRRDLDDEPAAKPRVKAAEVADKPTVKTATTKKAAIEKLVVKKPMPKKPAAKTPVLKTAAIASKKARTRPAL